MKKDPFIRIELEEGETIKAIYCKEIPNRYFISSKGRVFDLYNNKFKELKLHKVQTGYLQAYFPKINKKNRYDRKNILVHKLVTNAFITDNIPKGYSINHISGIKTDNRLENLEVIPHKLNIEKAYKEGLRKRSNNYCHATNNQILDALRMLTKNIDKPSIDEISNITGLSKSQVSYISRFPKYFYYIATTDLSQFNTIKIDDKLLRQLYKEILIDNKTIDDTALKFNISPLTIENLLSNKYKEKMNGLEFYKKDKHGILDIDLIKIHEMFEDGETIKNIAIKYNCSESVINDIIRIKGRYKDELLRLGLESKEIFRYDSKKIKDENTILCIIIDYINNYANIEELSKKYNCGRCVITSVLFGDAYKSIREKYGLVSLKELRKSNKHKSKIKYNN